MSRRRDSYKDIKNKFRREKSNSFAVKTTDDLSSPLAQLIAEKKDSQILRENLKQAVMMGKNLNKENTSLREDGERLQTEIKIYRNKLEIVEQQLKDTRVVNDKLEETFREQRDLASLRTIEVDDLKKTVEKLRVVQSDYERVLKRNKKLRMDLKRADDNLSREKDSTSMIVIDELDEAVGVTIKDTNAKRKRANELQKQVESLEKQVNFYKREREEGNDRNAALIKKLQVSFKEELETRMEEYETVLQTKDDEIHSHRNSLQKLKQSLVFESEEKKKQINMERNMFKGILEKERKKMMDGFIKMEGEVQRRLNNLNGKLLNMTVHGVKPMVSKEEHQTRLQESREARIRLLIQHREQKIRNLEEIAGRLDQEMLFQKNKICNELENEQKYQDEIMSNTYEKELHKVHEESNRIVKSLKTRVVNDIQNQVVQVKNIKEKLGEIQELQQSSLNQHKGKVHELEKAISTHEVIVEGKEHELSTISSSFSSSQTILKEISSLQSLSERFELEIRAQGVRNRELEKLVEKGHLLVERQKKNLAESMSKNREMKTNFLQTKQKNHRSRSKVSELESKMCKKENEIEMLTEKNKRLNLNCLELKNRNVSQVEMINKLKSDIKNSKIRILKNVIEKQRVQLYRLGEILKTAETNLKGVNLNDLRLFKFLLRLNENKLGKLRSKEDRCQFMEGNLVKQVRVLKGVIQRQKEEIDELKDNLKDKMKFKQRKLSEFKKRKKIRKCQNVIKLQKLQIRKLKNTNKIHEKKLSLDGDNSVLIDVITDHSDSDEQQSNGGDERGLVLGSFSSEGEESVISPPVTPKRNVLEL